MAERARIYDPAKLGDSGSMNGAMLQFSVAVAGAVIFFGLARLAVAGMHRVFGPGLGWVRPGLSALDHILVERISVWVGLSESRAWRRWLRMGGSFLLTAAMGAFLPSLVAVPALITGLVAVVAVFRRWAWDEEDRALGLSPQEKRAKGVEDFNDEVLAALAAVFMLASLLVGRLTGLHAFTESAPGGIGPYLLYMASEALEALPIIGNVEVLGYENPSGVNAVLPTGGWIAFGLRMALDLVVIGGLLKAIEIAGRVARGQDLRREDEAIREGRPERVKQAVATLTRLALGEDLNALERLKQLAWDRDAAPAPPRFRLIAMGALNTVAEVRPIMAGDIYRFMQTAANDLERAPQVEEQGLRPAAFLMLFNALQALQERSHGEQAISLLDAAATALAHAITAPGHSPFLETLDQETPGPMTPLQRADLAIRYASLRLTMGEMVKGEGGVVYLDHGLRMIELALRTVTEDEHPEDWSWAWLIRGQLLVRLSERDAGPDGEHRLLEAREAFETSARVRDRYPGTAPWCHLRLAQGVVEVEMARRREGEEALDGYQRASDLYIEAANGMIEADGDPADVARALFNNGNVLMDAGRLRASADVPDKDAVVAMTDQAIEAYLHALRILEGLDQEADRLTVERALAEACVEQARWSGDRDFLALAAATRQGILERIDQARDPVAWAVAALEASQIEHEVGKGAVAEHMTRSAVERVLRARPILERYQLTDLIARSVEMEREMQETIARFLAAEAGAPDGKTVH